MKYFILVLVALAFISLSGSDGSAQTKGEGWQLYYADESGKKFYYDRGSLESPQKGIFKVWQKISETVRGEEEQDNFKTHMQINCRDKTYEVLSYIEYEGVEEIKMDAREYKNKPPTSRFSLESRMGVLYDNICP